jgi:APA family basic amino acid/polyamine antiporter
MAEDATRMEATAVTDSGLFVRNATGLVRGMSQRASIALNFIPGHPTQTLSAVVFYFITVFAGANMYLALLLVLPMTLSFSYAFGLLTQMIPRSGGDYMLVSRVIHPLVGIVSSFCMSMAGFLSNAFFGLAFAVFAVSPSAIAIGNIGGYNGLTTWGQDVAASRWWQFFLGAAMITVSSLVHMAGWRWMIRFLTGLFWFVTGGMVLTVLVLLIRGKDTFAKGFDSFAGAGQYQGTIDRAVKAGADLSPSFSFTQTLALVAALATVSIYCYWSTFVGGELRQASTLKTANNMALGGTLGLIVVAIFGAFIFSGIGEQFIRAAQSGGLPSGLPLTNPTYIFLTGASVNNVLFAIILALSYCVFWPLICWLSLLQPTRMLFAYSFDGMLPKFFSLTTRSGAPWVCVVVSGGASILVLLWATSNQATLFKVLAFATLIQLIAMALVGLAGILAPRTRPELYRASASQKTVGGIPLVQIAGLGCIATAVFLYIEFLHEPALGIAKRGEFLLWAGGTVLAGVVFYYVARAVRASQGVNVDLAFAEIPPE